MGGQMVGSSPTACRMYLVVVEMGRLSCVIRLLISLADTKTFSSPVDSQRIAEFLRKLTGNVGKMRTSKMAKVYSFTCCSRREYWVIVTSPSCCMI